MKQPLDLVGAEQRLVTILVNHHTRSARIAYSKLSILKNPDILSRSPVTLVECKAYSRFLDFP